MYYSEYKEMRGFVPQKLRFKDKFLLFFKRMRTETEILHKTEDVTTTKYTKYKVMKNTLFLLDEYCIVTVKLPDILIGA